MTVPSLDASSSSSEENHIEKAHPKKSLQHNVSACKCASHACLFFSALALIAAIALFAKSGGPANEMLFYSAVGCSTLALSLCIAGVIKSCQASRQKKTFQIQRDEEALCISSPRDFWKIALKKDQKEGFKRAQIEYLNRNFAKDADSKSKEDAKHALFSQAQSTEVLNAFFDKSTINALKPETCETMRSTCHDSLTRLSFEVRVNVRRRSNGDIIE